MDSPRCYPSLTKRMVKIRSLEQKLFAFFVNDFTNIFHILIFFPKKKKITNGKKTLRSFVSEKKKVKKKKL